MRTQKWQVKQLSISTDWQMNLHGHGYAEDTLTGKVGRFK